MAETSVGGWVTRAATSSASTRPSASARPTVSPGSGAKAAVMRARASATDSMSDFLCNGGFPMSAGEFSPQRHHGTKDFKTFFVLSWPGGESVFLRPSEYETLGLAL